MFRKLATSGNWNSYFKLPNPGLRAYFQHVVEGNPDVYRTPFYNKRDVQEVCDQWSSTLNSIEDEWPSLVAFENDLRKKVGPMSVMFPLKERISDIDSYYESILLDSEPLDDSAIASVVKEWGAVAGLRQRSHLNTTKLMKLSTNSGSPYFTRRRLVYDTAKNSLAYISPRNEAEVIIEDNSRIWKGCAILGWRGQEGGPSVNDVKQRVVWMFPFDVNIMELQVYQPFVEASQSFNLVPAWVGMDAVDECITKLFDTKEPDDFVVCTDFTAFDQHFNANLQSAAAKILSGVFTENESFTSWLESVFPIKYMIPLAFDWEKIRFGRHGMASGSGGTNVDETLSHRALQYESALKQGAKLNPYSQCLGDDGILTYPGISVDKVVETYCSHGLSMNTDKQYADKQTCIYLRRWHHKDYRIGGRCVGVYSTYRAIGRLAMQERYYDPEVWGPKAVALRQLSILENIKWHPLRERFVKFCMEGDKFRLGLDIPGFFDNIDLEVKKLTNAMPDFMGYTRSLDLGNRQVGIKNW